jgi:uncharacterized protein YifE (UPF0438 family)
MMTIEEKCMRNTIDMVHKAGFKEHNGMVYVTTINDDCAKELKAFEALVRADERNRTWTQEHWTEYERSIAAQEREACLNCYSPDDTATDWADKIRARSKA